MAPSWMHKETLAGTACRADQLFLMHKSRTASPRLPLSAVSPPRQQHVVVTVLVVVCARHCAVNLDGVQIRSARSDRATGSDWHCKCAGRPGYPSYPKAQFANKTQARGGPARLQGSTTCSPWHQNNTTMYGVPVLRTDRLPCGLVGAPVTQKLG
jgi:hypothetical protein